MRYFIEIENCDGEYRGKIHQGDLRYASDLRRLSLGSDSMIVVNRQSLSLGQLIEKLLAHRLEDREMVFNERGQLDLGQHLYSQTFGQMRSSDQRNLKAEPVEVRIITDDEHIARLPWVLLAEGGVFLSSRSPNPWSVAFTRSTECQSCELPPSPRILAVMPEPLDMKTQARQHLERLEDMLSAANRHHTLGKNLKVACTWDEFKQEVNSFGPDVIYYYGHGVGNAATSSLVFADSDGRRKDIPIIDVANCLCSAPDGPPLLSYINCCLGDAGGFLGVGRQLGRFVPAVVTNFTLASVEAAQSQALDFWRSILLNGASPERAIAETRASAVKLNLSYRDLRWMTPVLHCNYESWKFSPPKPLSRLERDPHWRLKLNRIRQFGQVAIQTREMLENHRPRSLSYLWYGLQGQGVDVFHQRLAVELQKLVSDAYLFEVQPYWPPQFHDFHISIRDMLTDVFRVQNLDEIPERIRTETRNKPQRQTLVYVRHEPIVASPGADKQTTLIDPGLIKKYLQWWDLNLVPLLEGNMFALLGMSFVVRKPAAFRKRITEIDCLDDLDLDRTVFHLLDEMQAVERQDILNFLRSNNIVLPPDVRNRCVNKILAESGGQYEKVLEMLKDLEAQPWDVSDASEEGAPPISGEYDY